MDAEAAAIGLRDRAQLVDGRGGSVPALGAQIDRDEGLGRLTVGGEERSGDPVLHRSWHAGERSGIQERLMPIGCGQARWPVVDHHCGKDIR